MHQIREALLKIKKNHNLFYLVRIWTAHKGVCSFMLSLCCCKLAESFYNTRKPRIPASRLVTICHSAFIFQMVLHHFSRIKSLAFTCSVCHSVIRPINLKKIQTSEFTPSLKNCFKQVALLKQTCKSLPHWTATSSPSSAHVW